MEVIIRHNDNAIISTEDTWRVDILKLQPPFHTLSVSIPFDDQICYFNEDEMPVNVPISRRFVQQLRIAGYRLVAKLGRGTYCVAYLSYDVDKLVTVLIRDNEVNKNDTLKEDNIIKLVQSLPYYDLYLNKVYETLYIDTPYSDNSTYLKSTVDNFGDRPILILEYLPLSIKEYLSSLDNKSKAMTKQQLCEFVIDARDYFTIHKVEYIDIYDANIMVGFDNDQPYFKLVDIQGMYIGSDYKHNTDSCIRYTIDRIDATD